MDDLISRQAAIDEIVNTVSSIGRYDNTAASYGAALRQNEIIDIIEKLPSAQPERIRCSHCKKYDRHDHRCKHWNHGVSNVDWCSYAERKEDG